MFGKYPVYAFHIFIIEAMYYAMNHTLLPRDISIIVLTRHNTKNNINLNFLTLNLFIHEEILLFSCSHARKRGRFGNLSVF